MKTQPLLCTLALSLCCPPLARAAADLDEAIRKVRMGTLVIQAAPNTEIRVELLRHEFWFGAALASQMFTPRADAATAARYREVFLANFNAAVTENALKWHAMEPQQGQVDYSIVDAILAWTDHHHIPLRGHNIFSGVLRDAPGPGRRTRIDRRTEERQRRGAGDTRAPVSVFR